jgi:2-succinyl-6-hydroxy-2,4-cyclohexadiene-1-carboxylate synthase
VRVCLVHGFTQRGESWAPVAGILRGHDHEVITPDLPGHGTRAHVDADLWATASILADEVGPAVWVGYSLGGRACLHLALAHPDVALGLVLVSTTAGIEDAAERDARRRSDDALAKSIEAEGVEKFVDRWLDGPLWASLPRAQAGVPVRLTNTADGLASSLRRAGTGAQEPLWDRLPEVRAPSVVVTGGLDEKFTATGARLAEGLGGGQVTFPERGHALPWEDPPGFAGWLATQRPDRW